MKVRIYISVALLLYSNVMSQDIWIASPSHKILRTEKSKVSSIYKVDSKTIRLHSAKNEFVSFQIVYSGSQKGIEVPELELKNNQGKELAHIEFFREHYVKAPVVSQYDSKNKVPDCLSFNEYLKKIEAPREFPVHMVPAHAKKFGFPITVNKGRNETVWVDIFIPEGQMPGLYKGKLKTAGEIFKVELLVWDFELPSVNHFPYWAYTGPEQIAWGFKIPHQQIGKNMDMFNSYFKMAHNHRLSMSEGLEYAMKYAFKPDRNYVSHYSGELFKDEIFAPGVGFGLFAVIPSDEKFEYFKKANMLNRIFHYVYDEPGNLKAYNMVLEKGHKTLNQYNGQFRTMVTEQIEPSKKDWPSLKPAINIFCSGHTPPEYINKLEKEKDAFGGRTVVWTYNSGHAGAPWIDAPGPALRTHAWAGFMSGARSWFFWDSTYIVDKQMKWKHAKREINKNPAKYIHDHWNDALNFDESKKRRGNGFYNADWSMRLNGDGLLLYPGLDAGVMESLASFRLKNLRIGAQDFEYLYLLEKMGEKEFALQIVQEVIGKVIKGVKSEDGQAGGRIYKYQTDSEAWVKARFKLGEKLNSIGDSKIKSKIVPYNQFPNPVGHPDFFNGDRY